MKYSSTHRPGVTRMLKWLIPLSPLWLRSVLASMVCHLLLTVLFNRWEESFPATALLLSLLAGCLLTLAASLVFTRHTPLGNRPTAANPSPARSFLLVQSADQHIAIPVEQVSCIYRVGRHTLLRTFEKTEYLLPQSLREVMTQLDETRFFQVNRRLIVQRGACKSYRTAPHGKLLLTLHPPLSEAVTVSQGKTPLFRRWMAG